jgi:hypothetical protein
MSSLLRWLPRCLRTVALSEYFLFVETGKEVGQWQFQGIRWMLWSHHIVFGKVLFDHQWLICRCVVMQKKPAVLCAFFLWTFPTDVPTSADISWVSFCQSLCTTLYTRSMVLSFVKVDSYLQCRSSLTLNDHHGNVFATCKCASSICNISEGDLHSKR